MKINHHYGESYDRNLLDFLLSIGFAKEDLLEEYSRLIVFDIYDDDERLHLIKEKYPDYYPYYEAALQGNTYYYGNLMVASREVFQEYAKWLFDILFEIEML